MKLSLNLNLKKYKMSIRVINFNNMFILLTCINFD